MTVIESGFSELDVPEEARQNQFKDNTGGSLAELASLCTRAEEAAPA